MNYGISALSTDDGNDNTVALYEQIEITYEAYLNEDAVVGSEGNENDANLIYKTTTTEESTAKADSPAIYTYAIELQKLFDGKDSGGDFTSVTFELQDEEGNQIAVAYDNDDGYWYVTGAVDPDNTNYEITLTDNGKLKLHGLEAGTYYLVETATDSGYNLLAEKIEIVIISNEGTYEDENETGLSDYYTQNDEGTFAMYQSDTTYYLDSEGSVQFVMPIGVADGSWVNFGTSSVYTDDGEGGYTQVSMYTTGTLRSKATVGGSDVTNNNGTFGTVNVNNQSGFWLPQTGGSGTFWFLVSGGIVVVAAITVIVAVTRKKGGARAS